MEQIGKFDERADYPAAMQNSMGPVLANLDNLSTTAKPAATATAG